MLALTGFETAIGFVDHIHAAPAANDAAVAMATFEGFERVADFHGKSQESI